jgi:hypothetical protein
MLKPSLAVLLGSSAMVTLWPAAAGAQQFRRTPTATYTYYEQPQVGRSQRRYSSERTVVSDRFYNNYPSSIRQHGGYSSDFDRSERIDGFRQPATVIIIQQPVYAYPASTCSTAVVGSPIPLPYARDTRTGLPCN